MATRKITWMPFRCLWKPTKPSDFRWRINMTNDGLFDFMCPSCKSAVQAPLADRYKKMTCSKCGKSITIPYSGFAPGLRPKLMFCTACHTSDQTVLNRPGSSWIEIILWLFCLLPGLIYSIWRSSSVHRVCSRCGSRDVIPDDSPRARELREQL